MFQLRWEKRKKLKARFRVSVENGGNLMKQQCDDMISPTFEP